MNTIDIVTTDRRNGPVTEKLPIRGRSSKCRPPESSMPKGVFKGLLPENVLTLLAFDDEAIPIILAQGLSARHFESDVYRRLAEECIGYYKNYMKAAANHLPDLVEDRLISKKRSQVRMFTDALKDIYSTKDDVNRDFVLDQLGDFIEQQELKRTVIDMAESIQRNDVAEARECLRKGLERATTSRSDGILGLEGAIQPYGQFDDTEFPPVESALSPVLDFPGMLQINGFRGHFKSGLAGYMAVALSAGKDVFGWHCNRPYKVKLVDGELPPATIQKRIRGVIDDLGVRAKLVRRNLHVLSKNQKLLKGPINLADPKQHDELLEHFCQFEVVFLDSIVMLTSGVDLDTGQGWEAINTLCNSCIANGTSIVRLQHLGKDKSRGGIGSSYQEFPVDFILQVEQQTSDTFHGNTTIKVTSTKHRNCAPGVFRPIELELSKGTRGQLTVSHSVAYQSKTEALAEKILHLILSGDWEKTNKTKFAEKYGVARKTVYIAEEQAEEELERQEGERSLIK